MFLGNKLKAVTFSFDDAVTQDQRLIEIFNKYNLKCTFNINFGNLGRADSLIREGVTVAHVKPQAYEIENIYKGHEVAGHTLTHPPLNKLNDEDIIREVEQDRIMLSKLVGYEVVGMAYPNGTSAYEERVGKLIKEHTGIKYARLTTSTFNFEPQTDLIEFQPTVYFHKETEKAFELAEKFINLKPEKEQIFYIWAHAYEFDIHNTWAEFERFCALISNKPDIFYGTNKEVLLK